MVWCGVRRAIFSFVALYCAVCRSLGRISLHWLRCVALRFVALPCVALHFVALRCVHSGFESSNSTAV